MATKEEILDAIGAMTVLELSELLSEFEEKFGVTAAAPAAVAAAPAGGDAPEEEEKDSFDVVLTSAGEKKIQVIKEVRGLTSLSNPFPATRLSSRRRACRKSKKCWWRRPSGRRHCRFGSVEADAEAPVSAVIPRCRFVDDEFDQTTIKSSENAGRVRCQPWLILFPM